MRTILVADPRKMFQDQIERAVSDYGFATTGAPDLVLTPDATTAKLWSRRHVPVLFYQYDDPIDIAGMMLTAFALLDP